MFPFGGDMHWKRSPRCLRSVGALWPPALGFGRGELGKAVETAWLAPDQERERSGPQAVMAAAWVCFDLAVVGLGRPLCFD